MLSTNSRTSAFVTEFLRHGQTGQRNADGYLVARSSESVNQDAVQKRWSPVFRGRSRYPHEYARAHKHGITGVLDRDVTDQLHHVYGFTYARTAEQTDFTALGEMDKSGHYAMQFPAVPGSWTALRNGAAR